MTTTSASSSHTVSRQSYVPSSPQEMRGSIHATHNARNYRWLYSSLLQGSLSSALCFIFDKSLSCLSSDMALWGAGGLCLGGAILWWRRKDVYAAAKEFSKLSRYSKALTVCLPIILGVTGPLLLERLARPSLVVEDKFLIYSPLVMFSMLLPLMKAQDAEIDAYFLRGSPGAFYLGLDNLALETWLTQAYQHIHDQAANPNPPTTTNNIEEIHEE